MALNNQVNVNLNFTANTQSAKQAIASLQQSLTQLSMGNTGIKLDEASLKRASTAALELQQHLAAAMNVDTGKLNLGKLNQSLAMSKTNLTHYMNELRQAGPIGEQSFMQLSRAIAQAEAPVFRLQGAFARLWTQMKNVASYQLTTAAYRTIVKSISEAYNFAQDLNESLTNIRIVTDYSADEMDRFARNANKAAKALSTTTKTFTDASLIYFQQGLSMAEAEERAAITIKLANVTGESVEQVSDQLTAVWNNFDNGTRSLEQYVDILAALGAATASSTDEITQGLEKFASVAETVGLSYEYAAAALATVTATTRQSADVVGTAFKTLFARIQDLELGKTLDDGTTLGKYSQALASVGISIKDSNGALRDMDDILNDMGAKWDTLSRDQQTALAQNVAGVRQYTQLMALMENWDYFNQNLQVAADATGTLTEQNEKYAESWKAAKAELTATLEGLYQELLNDDFFIKITKGIANWVEGIDAFVEKLGGIKPIILSLVSLLMTSFSHKIQPAINSALISIQTMFPGGAAKVQGKMGKETNDFIKSQLNNPNLSQEDRARLKGDQLANETNAKYALNQNKMTEAEKAAYEVARKERERIQNLYEQSARTADEILLKEKQITETYEKRMKAINTKSGRQAAFDKAAQIKVEADEVGANLVVLNEQRRKKQAIVNSKNKNVTPEAREVAREQLETINKLIDEQQNKYDALMLKVKQYMDMFKAKATISIEEDQQQRVIDLYKNIAGQKPDQQGMVQGNASMFQVTTGTIEELKAKIQEAKNAGIGLGESFDQIDEKLNGEALKQKINEFNKALENPKITLEVLIKYLQSIGHESTIDLIDDQAREAAGGIKQIKEQAEEAKEKMDKLGESAKKANNNTSALAQHKMGGLESFVAATGALTQFSMVAQQLISLVRVLEDDSMSAGQKILTIMTTIGMMVPTIISAIKAIGQAINSSNVWLFVLGLAITIITSVVAWVRTWKTESEKLADQLNTLSHNLTEIEKAAELAEQKLSDITTLFSEYENFNTTLSRTKQGTEEWNEALHKTQETLNEIIKMYPQLAGASFNGEKAFDFDEITGLYKMGGWVESYAIETATVDAMRLDAAKTMLQLSQSQLETQKAYVDANKAFEDKYFYNPIEFNSKNYDTNTIIFGKRKFEFGTSSENEASEEIITKGLTTNTTLEGASLLAISQYSDALTKAAQAYMDMSYTSDYQFNSEDIKNIMNSKEVLAIADQKLQNHGYTLGKEQKAEIADMLVDELVSTVGSVYDEAQTKLNQELQAFETKLIALAQTNLSRYGVFSSLDATAKNATTQLIANEYKKYSSSHTSITADQFRTDADMRAAFLEDYMGYSESESTGSKTGWRKYRRTKNQFKKTEAGQDIINKYKEIKGYTATATNYTDTGVTFKGMDANFEDLGENFVVTYDQMIAEIMSEQLGKDIDEGKILSQINELSNQGELGKAIIAGITGSFTSLSPEEVAKISNDTGSGFTEDYISKWAEGLEMSVAELKASEMFDQATQALQTYDAALAETQALQRDVAAGNSLIAQAATELDLDEDALKNYAKTIQNLNSEQEINYEQAAKLAVANARMSKGLEELRKNFNSQLQILKTYDKESYEVIEAATEMAESLAKVFGVDSLSSDFVLNNLSKIEQAVNGDIEVFKELELAVAQDYILNLAISDEYKGQLTNILDYIDALPDSSIGITADLDPGYIEQLNEMLKKGAVTADQLTDAFSTIGWSPNIGYREEDGPITTTTMNGSITGPGGREIFHLSGDFTSSSKVQVPYIKTEGEGGSDNNAITSLGQKSYESNITSKTPSSGGGGSKKEKKNSNDEIERYHVINEVLDDTRREYDAISKAADRAFGNTKLSYLDKQIKKQKEINNGLKQYYDEINTNYDKDKEAMRQYGATFDEAGRITNYEALMQANIDAYNVAVDKFNAGQMSEDVFETYEKAYDKFIEDMERYEETLNLREDVYLEWVDGLLQEIDDRLAKANYEIELDISLKDDSLTLLEYQISRLGDSADEAKEKVENLYKAALQESGKYETNKRGIREVLKPSIKLSEEETAGKTEAEIDALRDARVAQILSAEDLSSALTQFDIVLTEDQIASLREYRDGMIESAQAMDDYKTKIEDSVITAFEDLNAEMEKSNEIISKTRSIAQGFRDIVDLVGADNLGISDEVYASMQQNSVDLATQQLTASKAILDTRKQEKSAAEAELKKAQDAGNTELTEYWEKQLETINSSMLDAEADFMSSWTETLQAAADALTASSEQAAKSFKDAMAGDAGTSEYLETMFDRSKELSDLHLADYEKIYQISKLNRSIQNSMDKSVNAYAKNQMREIQEEVLALQESSKDVSQYELDILQAKYELRKAEIAMEEAQNAKSQVRMSRDAEGNWGYIYTADEALSDSAIQNYEDKLYALQDLNQKYIEEAQENLATIPAKLAEELARINADTSLSEEQRRKMIDETIAHYDYLYQYWGGQLGTAMDDAKEIYEEDWKAYSARTGYKISADEKWINSWNETKLATITGEQSLEGILQKFSTKTLELKGQLDSYWSSYADNIETAMNRAGVALGEDGATGKLKTFAQVAQEKMNETKTAAEEASGAVAQIGTKGATAFEQLASAASAQLTNFQTAMGGYRDEIDKEVGKINDLILKYAQLDKTRDDSIKDTSKNEEEKDNGGAKAGTPPENTNNINNDNKRKKQDNKFIEHLEPTPKFQGYKAYYYDVYQKKWLSNSSIYKSKDEAIAQAQYLTDQTWILTQKHVSIARKDYDDYRKAYDTHRKQAQAIPVYLDTGGYTGSWDSTGRLAVLHQKELVLNAHDTENFLAGINVLRTITQAIDLRAAAQTGYLSELARATIAPSANQTIEQQITIHAEFPYANNRYEIEEAFNSLLNHSSQFANRKN